MMLARCTVRRDQGNCELLKVLGLTSLSMLLFVSTCLLCLHCCRSCGSTPCPRPVCRHHPQAPPKPSSSSSQQWLKSVVCCCANCMTGTACGSSAPHQHSCVSSLLLHQLGFSRRSQQQRCAWAHRKTAGKMRWMERMTLHGSSSSSGSSSGSRGSVLLQ